MTLGLNRIMADDLRDAIDCLDFLLAEARWWAAELRADAWDYCRSHDDPDSPTPGEDVIAFPWETL